MPPKGWRKNKSPQEKEEKGEIDAGEGQSTGEELGPPPSLRTSSSPKEDDVYFWTETQGSFPLGTKLVLMSTMPIRGEYTRPDGTRGLLHTDSEAFAHFKLKRKT